MQIVRYLEYCSLPMTTQLFPMGGFCFFFHSRFLALILESPTAPIDEKGMHETKKDLSSPANFVTESIFGFSSSLPAIDMPEKSKKFWNLD